MISYLEVPLCCLCATPQKSRASVWWKSWIAPLAPLVNPLPLFDTTRIPWNRKHWAFSLHLCDMSTHPCWDSRPYLPLIVLKRYGLAYSTSWYGSIGVDDSYRVHLWTYLSRCVPRRLTRSVRGRLGSFLVPSRLSKDQPSGSRTVLSLSLRSDLRVGWLSLASAPVVWDDLLVVELVVSLSCGGTTTFCWDSSGLQFCLQFLYLCLKSALNPLCPLLGIKMHPVSRQSVVINHSQRVSISLNLSSLGFSATKLPTISFHGATSIFKKSAIAEPASSLKGLVDKTTILGLNFSFSSLRRQISSGSQITSSVTGLLGTSFVPIMRISVSTLSPFCSSIILITWATHRGSIKGNRSDLAYDKCFCQIFYQATPTIEWWFLDGMGSSSYCSSKL